VRGVLAPPLNFWTNQAPCANFRTQAAGSKQRPELQIMCLATRELDRSEQIQQHLSHSLCNTD
jgi:hypothetical protein